MLKIKKNTTIQKARWEQCFSENSNKGDATPPVTQVSGVPASFSSTINHPNWNTGAHDAALGHFPLPGDVVWLTHLTRSPSPVLLVPIHHDRWAVRRGSSSSRHLASHLQPVEPRALLSPSDWNAQSKLQPRASTVMPCIPSLLGISSLLGIMPASSTHPRALPIIRTSNWTCLTTKSSTISFFPFPSPATAPFLCFDYGLFLKGVHKDAPSFYKMNFPLGNPAICLLLEDVCDLRYFFLPYSLSSPVPSRHILRVPHRHPLVFWSSHYSVVLWSFPSVWAPAHPMATFLIQWPGSSFLIASNSPGAVVTHPPATRTCLFLCVSSALNVSARCSFVPAAQHVCLLTFSYFRRWT